MPTTSTGTIKQATLISGTNNPAYQVSKDVWNTALAVGGGATGGLMVRDSLQGAGWGFLDAVVVGRVLGSAGVGVLPVWTTQPALEGIIFGLGTPAILPDGLFWAEASGTSGVDRVISLKVRDGGNTFAVATTTANP